VTVTETVTAGAGGSGVTLRRARDLHLIDRNSERGQFVPAVRADTGVKVRTAAAVIVSGSF
jgi:hypothetical protein